MSKYFGRFYHLEVKTAAGETLAYSPPMEIKFAVDNFPQNLAGLARITIYGVSARARELIQLRNNDEHHFGFVSLQAGYEEQYGNIFAGRINSVQVFKDGINTCIRLNCSSVSTEWDASTYQTWGENTPYLEVIRDIAAKLGPPVYFVGDFSDLPTLPFGANGGGKLCRLWLDLLARNFGFSWFHLTNRTVITRKGESRAWVKHELSSKNGMESAPRWYADRLEVDVKLNHLYQPSDRIDITSSFWTLNFSGAYHTDYQDLYGFQKRTGVFSLLNTSHEGSFWGDPWKTTLGCVWYQEANNG
ncbi:Uncharacterised protein [Klebsiella oxytoca]|uniref:hypothetical protein n=1 Tax=Klebsiella oxytoca TaxID=571 RepID=UPI0007CCD456|nr:hypothetical protein [Klebsiella oxytoca]MBG2596738.1 hypothetical protein [Klebsiella oxytoca]SAQ10420.1 Uncharacterised protein [Klebsiella oxytoca]SBL71631.1 Uncharacterised protein [Klebsiella oxytoca]SBL84575.1 Uncharacterised protein [Klebsiella oxytoca]HCF8092304.1 hypothetical protein [Klebsiella oxytoca]